MKSLKHKKEDKSSSIAIVPGSVALIQAKCLSGGGGRPTPNTPPASQLQCLECFYFQDYLLRISLYAPRLPPFTNSTTLSRPDERPFQ